MGYTPLFDTMLSGTLYGRWPHTGVWGCLLSRVSRAGTIDEHPNALAAAIGCPLEVLKQCIHDFMQPDPDSRTPDHDGRRLELIDPSRTWGWRVINHRTYKEKARKKSFDEERTDSGVDAERKRAQRAEAGGDTRCPDESRAVPLSSPTPKPSPTPEPRSRDALRADSRATRLPDDFSLTPERRASAESEGVPNVERTFASFRDHWLAAPGVKGRKTDWDATWRNWCRREADMKPARRSSSLSDRITYRPTE